VGRPRLLQADRRYCVLHQEGFVAGYSPAAMMALWSSFSLLKPVSQVAMETSRQSRDTRVMMGASNEEELCTVSSSLIPEYGFMEI